MARDPKYDILFKPIRIGPKTLKNRFWQTSHCTGYGSERPGTQAGFRGMKAEGGWGAVFTEACSIHPESDEYPFHLARIWDQGDVLNLGHMCEALHRHGALAGIQLWYSGCHPPAMESREVPRDPSGLPSNVFPERTVYGAEMDEDDIRALMNMYVEAAKRAERAGFDILEISAGDNTIPAQFLDHRYNRRTDRYGGSLENRLRFFLEVAGSVKRACGQHCAVTTRYEVDDLLGERSLRHFDEGIRAVELIHREGLLDAWSVKIGDYEEWGEDAGSSRFRKSNWMRPFVAEVKGIVGEVPVVNNGRFTSPDDMLAALTNGQCDIIGAARPSIADPFLPAKIAEGRFEDIRECIGCNMCVSKMQQQALLFCTQNPTSGEEYRRGWHPETFEKTKNPCSVLVVGGGPAGMECAMVLGKRGYDVHLCEAEKELGGHWRMVSRYPRCSEWARVITYRESQLKKLKNVELHLGRGEMTAETVLKYGADRAVIATGAHWSANGLGAETHRPIPGADASLPHVCTPEQIMAGKSTGKRVVVFDGEGHFTGLAMAELMADQGKATVTLVTNMNEMTEYTRYTMELQNNKRLMYEKKITPIRNHWAHAIEPGKIQLFYLYRDSPELYEIGPGQWGRRESADLIEIPCDTVILCTSRVPNNGLYRALRARQSEWDKYGLQAIYRIGDCHAPRQCMNAIFDGHRLAREFDGPHPQYPLPFIRERQLWGQPTTPQLGDARPRVEVD
ncbi:MAG TPA: FAD-dependent oxidoreductase [Alphaproteobacteria bacterium]|nr:FAD-dependent oxidoreductase [Alphaproteobacteria bacterium]